MSSSSFDFVIIGGGTAGLVVASRLSENPSYSVLVLEAGQDHSDDPRVKTPAFYATLPKSEMNWGFHSEPQPALNGRSIGLYQGRALGGSSATNCQVFVHPGEQSIDAWEKAGNTGWNWKTLERYLARTCTFSGEPQTTDAQQTAKQHLLRPVQVAFAGDPSHPVHKAWKDTFQAKGQYVSSEGWIRQPTGAFSNLATVDPSTKERSYATTAYYNPIKDRNNLKVLTDAMVERIIFETDKSDIRATGVRYRCHGTVQTVIANKEVVLAAGALQSPKLLELSGVGDARVLSKNGIQVVQELPGVGENLQDHIVCPLSVQALDELETMDPLAREEPEAIAKAMHDYATHQTGMLTSSGMTTYAFMPTIAELSPDAAEALKKLLDQTQPRTTSGPGSVYADLHELVAEALIDRTKPSGAYLSVLAQAGATPVAGAWLTLVAYLPRPLSLGSVHILSARPSDVPVIDPKYLSHPVDTEVFAHQMRYLADFASSAPFNELLKQPSRYLDPATSLADMEGAKDHIRRNAISMWHYSGTCAMLPKEKGGVVDAQLKVHGIPNLRVVDSSIIPIITIGNLQSTVYAVAERAADLIKNDYHRSKS